MTRRSGRLRALVLGGILAAATLVVLGRVGPALDPARVARGASPVPALDVADQLSTSEVGATLIEGPERPADLILPKGQAGTRRTWFARGRWWAVLPDPVTGSHRIWTLDGAAGPWVDTGALVDERPFAQVDVTWSGQQLVVTATGTRDYRSHALRISRFTWSDADARWEREEDYPLTATDGGAPGTLAAVTAAGEVWMARPEDGRVVVAHTDGEAPRVGSWSVPPVPGLENDVGGVALTVEGDDVHLVWRSRTTDVLGLATWSDGQWRSRTIPVPEVAGDAPVEVGVEPGRPGSLLVLVPTVGVEGNGTNQAPALLLVRAADGTAAEVSVVGRVTDQLRTPALLLDERGIRVVAVAPSSEVEAERAVARGGRPTTAVVEKEASFDDLWFDPGRGRVLVAGVDGVDPSRPLVPGGPAGPEGGRLLVVSGREAPRWVTWTDGAPPPVEPAPIVDGRSATVLVNDTFEALPVGSPAPAAWYADADGTLPGLIDDPDLGGRALPVGQRAAEPDPLTACRSVPAVDGDSVTVEAVVRPLGLGDGDAKLLTVRGPTGSLVSIRRSRQGLIGWSTPEGRVTPAAVADEVSLRLTVGLDLRRGTTDILIRTLDGGPVAEVRGLPLLASGASAVDEVCLAPAPGVGGELRIDSLLVTLR